MPHNPTTLHILCGKIASGKSTLATGLAAQPATILVSEDQWLGTLFGDKMTSIKDYVIYSAKLRRVIGPHVSQVLGAGVSVVLDLPANTVENRLWMRNVFEATGAAHVLHHLDVPDQVCRDRWRVRIARGTHVFAATDEDFERVTQHFVPPSPEEGFNIVVHH